LAKQNRIRIILDNSKDHHNKQNSKPEDQFEKKFKTASGKNQLMIAGPFQHRQCAPRPSHGNANAGHRKSVQVVWRLNIGDFVKK
jgi:hypothetical protein